MAQKIINTKIQEAYDTEANWIKHNPVLLAGQLAFSKDKYGKYKIGDGVAKWSQLQYMTLGWSDITGKPSSFPPSSHTHDDRYFTETEATNKFSPKEGSASLSKLASTITLGVGDAATILQNGSTYHQKIEICDNSTSGDAVFGFYQSGDSGKNFNKLMTINDDGNVVANKFTGALAGNASSASSVPWSGVSGKPSTFPPSTHNHPASQITGLPTKLPNPYALTVKGNGALLNTYDGSGAKEINITPASIGAATSGHTHSQYAPTSHNHSADNITSGVLPIGRGGTGANNYQTALKNLVINGAGSGTAIPTDTNWYLCSDSADNNGTPVKRTMSSLWSYIKGKTDANYLKLSGTAVSASSIKVPDTRDTNPAPNNAGFKKNAVTFDFKSASKINSPTSNTYVGLMSFAPWGETSGGNGYQMAFGYINNTTPRLMLRTADLGATTWGTWHKVYTSADKPTLSELGAAAVSHTHNYAATSHTHTIANITSLQSTLDSKAPTNHTHSNYATITNLNLAIQRIDAHEKELGVHKSLIDGKAPSNHSHSYLPLSGGTLSGRLTANGRIYATTVGGGWISGMTPTNATLGISTQNTSGSYHPIISCKTYNSHVWNLGTFADTVGFYGFKKGRTENATDWTFTINVGNGAVSSTGNISAPTFNGSLNGNAKTATNVAWSGITGKPSTFAPSSHTHNAINDFSNGSSIGISSYTTITPQQAVDYDIVVANTNPHGNKLVTMGKSNFINHVISSISLKAITNAQIDSLASL